MSIIAERMRSLYNRFFSVDMLAKIMATVTPLLLAKEQFSQYFKSLFPSYIERIVHFDNKGGKTHVVYVARNNMYSMKRITYELLGLTRDGYYMFVVWNSFRSKYEHILLRGELVEKALEIKHIYNLWALHEHAIVLLLSNYVQYASVVNEKILGLTVNRKDVSKKLKPFMPSINIEDNVCPGALYMLLTYLDNDVVHMMTLKTSMCTYVNYDMEEVPIAYADQYIISSNLTSHPVTPCAPTMYKDVHQVKSHAPTDIEEDQNDVEELHEYPAQQPPSQEPPAQELKSPRDRDSKNSAYIKNKDL